MQDVQSRLRRLERRDWWLWCVVATVLLLLTAAVAFTTLTGGADQDIIFQVRQTLAVRGLVGTVLLFVTYMTYQQVQIKRLRGQLAEQMKVMIKLEVRAEEFEKLAILDPLTGLYNRRFAEHRLSEEVARARRAGNSLRVVMMDLDDFKQVNDRHGHAAGDLLLKHFAARLEKVIRVSDVAVRWGGDEFLMVLPDFRRGQVEELLHRLQPVEIEVQGQKVCVTLAAGWADYQAGETPEQLLERADLALYDRKNAAKNSGHAAPPKIVPVAPPAAS